MTGALDTTGGKFMTRHLTGERMTTITRYLFTYPDYGTPVGYPDHVAHSGQQCEIVRELGDDECDAEVGPMYVARFADGVEMTVRCDEMAPIVTETA